MKPKNLFQGSDTSVTAASATANKQTSSGIGSDWAKEWETAIRKALMPVTVVAGSGATLGMPAHASHRYVIILECPQFLKKGLSYSFK